MKIINNSYNSYIYISLQKAWEYQNSLKAKQLKHVDLKSHIFIQRFVTMLAMSRAAIWLFCG